MSGIAELNRVAAQTISGGDPALTDAIATGLELVHVLQVYTACMVTLCVWDWLVCLRSEYYRIWKRSWTPVKVLYLWTRYYGLLCFSFILWLFNGVFTAQQCKPLHWLIASTCMWASLGSEALIAVRTFAFIGRQRWLLVLLSTLLLGETAFLLYVSIAGVHQIPPIFAGRGPCTASDKPGQHVVSGYWLAPVAFDLICTFMTVFKALSLKRMGVKSHLITVFVREGLLYFIAVSAVNVLNAAFMFQRNPNLQYINSFLSLVLSQVLCCRMVLSLRAEYEKPIRPDGSTRADIIFKAGRNSRLANTHDTGDNVSIPLEKFQVTESRNGESSEGPLDSLKVPDHHPVENLCLYSQDTKVDVEHVGGGSVSN